MSERRRKSADGWRIEEFEQRSERDIKEKEREMRRPWEIFASAVVRKAKAKNRGNDERRENEHLIEFNVIYGNKDRWR